MFLRIKWKVLSQVKDFFVHKQATWGDSKSRDLKNHTRGVAEEVLVMMKYELGQAFLADTIVRKS